MKVTHILGTSILLLGVATTAFAQPAIRLSWDDCDPIVQNKNYAGPSIYNLVASASNVASRNNGHRTKVSIGPNVQDAWRFDAGACQLGNFAVSHNATKLCPALQGGPLLALDKYTFDAVSGKALFDVANSYTVFIPNPATRYILYQAKFNHQFSVAGAGDPALVCSFAADPLCFHLVSTELLLEGGSTIPFAPEQDFVTWNDPFNTQGCPGVVQAEATTWGRVKGFYR